MKGRKQDILVIIFAATLLIIIILIAFFALTANLSQKPLVPTPTPSPTPVALNGEPPVLYDKTAEDKLLDVIQKRPPLSSADSFAKANILSLLPAGKQSGILYETNIIRIDYTHSADIFQVEILTTDIQAAKNEANLWFRSHGVSQQGICIYPVSFYLNSDVAAMLRPTKIIFNPLANGC